MLTVSQQLLSPILAYERPLETSKEQTILLTSADCIIHWPHDRELLQVRPGVADVWAGSPHRMCRSSSVYPFIKHLPILRGWLWAAGPCLSIQLGQSKIFFPNVIFPPASVLPALVPVHNPWPADVDFYMEQALFSDLQKQRGNEKPLPFWTRPKFQRGSWCFISLWRHTWMRAKAECSCWTNVRCWKGMMQGLRYWFLPQFPMHLGFKQETILGEIKDPYCFEMQLKF